MALDFNEIEQELVVYLRNKNIISKADRGVTTTTDEFSGDASTTQFTLTNTNVKNVRSVTVGGSALTFGTDYTVNYKTAVVTFTTAPASGTNNVDIQYDYGTDSIYPDFPRADLKLSSYPRLAIVIISTDSTEEGTNADLILSNLVVSVQAYADKTEDVKDMIKNIRSNIITDKKNFYNFSLIYPVAVSPINPEPNRHAKIVSQAADFRIGLESE